jgi:thiamine-phosphate pyrophosphorylase
VNGAERRARLDRSRLYVCTGAREGHGDLPAFLDAILGAGVDVVQLREKDAEGGDLLRWGETFRSAADRHGALFVVNDRADIALAAGADGVHVGQGDLPVPVTRELVGPGVLIGLSTHTVGEREGAPAEADYVCVGPVHATPTKEGRPAAGIGVVEAAAEGEGRPWFAIGGLEPGTLPDVVRAGARRIVVVRAVTETSDPGAAVRKLLAALAR